MHTAGCRHLYDVTECLQPPPHEPPSGFLELVPHLFLALVFGVSFYFAQSFLVVTSGALQMEADQGLFMGLFAFQLSAMYFPYLLKK